MPVGSTATFGASKGTLACAGLPGRLSQASQGDTWCRLGGLNLDIKEGGHTIEYRDEDPYIRKMFQEQLAKKAQTSTCLKRHIGSLF